MSEPLIDKGVQTQPIPESGSDRTAQYAALQKVNPDWGKSDEPEAKPSDAPKDDKQEKPKLESVAQENGETKANGKPPKNGVEQRFGELTGTIKRLKAEIESLKSAKPKDVASPEKKLFTRESFKTDAEYLEYLADVKAEEKVNQRFEQNAKTNDELIQNRQSQLEFQRTWQERKQSVFDGNNDALEEFEDLVAENQEMVLPDNAWKVINKSEVGPFLLAVLLKDQKLRKTIDDADETSQIWFMRDLEKRVINHRASLASGSKPQAQKPQVSNAPTPVGMPNTGGVSKSDSELTMREQIELRKRERGLT